MTVLTRWDPFRELNMLQDRMNRLFQDYAPRGEQELTAGNFTPPVDIYEDEQNVTLKVEVPGLDPKDVDVRVENNTLTIRGERKFEKEEKGRELPSHRAALRRLRAQLHPAQHGGHRQREGRLR